VPAGAPPLTDASGQPREPRLVQTSARCCRARLAIRQVGPQQREWVPTAAHGSHQRRSGRFARGLSRLLAWVTHD